MPFLKEQIYTIEDIYALPDGERAELIDGQIYYMAPPGRKHQRITGPPPLLFSSMMMIKIMWNRISVSSVTLGN